MRLFVVLKVIGKCNLNCTYCNIFNGVDKTYQVKPAVLSVESAQALGKYLSQAIREDGISRVSVVLHGGEPLLMKPAKMREVINSVKQGIPDGQIDFSLQTNGILINQEWINLFSEFQINVGVSIDGPKKVHDHYRVDKSGSGSFDDVVAGIEHLKRALDSGLIPHLSVLAVWNPKQDATELYTLIVQQLGIKSFDVLMPDATHDNVAFLNRKGLEKFLCEIFDLWINEPQREVVVRIVASAFAMLVGGKSLLSTFGANTSTAITVDTDGEVRLDDQLRSCAHEFSRTLLSVSTSSFKDFKRTPLFRHVKGAAEEIPEACGTCAWEKVCRGGELIHRFGRGTFNNRSVYCKELSILFSHISKQLLQAGYSEEMLMSTLEIA